jgi:UDP-glucose 4-epimerase
MNILVTGGAGYIGSVAIEKLLMLGFNVFCLDNLSNGKLKAIEPNCTFFNGSFGDSDLLENIFSSNKIDFVFHFAAEANVPDSLKNPEKYYSTNIIYSINLLNKMIEHGINKLVFSSSAAVYGDPIYSPIDELHSVEPINPYGYTKLVFENIMKDYENAYGLEHISFRYFCAAGASSKHGESRNHESHLIPNVVDHILKKKTEIYVYGNDFDTIDGTGVRDYVHVEDIVNAHIMAIKKIKKCTGKKYNIGTSIGFSVLEVIKEAENIFSQKANLNIKERREGDPAILVATSDLIQSDFSWTPKRTLTDMLLSTYEWRKNPLY